MLSSTRRIHITASAVKSVVQLAAGGGHFRAAVTDALDVGIRCAELTNQIRAVQIAAGFASREKDFHACLRLVRDSDASRLVCGRAVTDRRIRGLLCAERQRSIGWQYAGVFRASAPTAALPPGGQQIAKVGANILQRAARAGCSTYISQTRKPRRATSAGK